MNNCEFYEMFIQEVIEEMKIQGLSQSELSDKTEISRASISRTLNGKLIPPLVTVGKIAGALGMKPVLCLMEDE